MINFRHELFGESVFTSFRTIDAKVLGLQEHIERLWRAAQVCYTIEHVSLIEFERYFFYQNELTQLFAQYPNHYFRLTIYADADLSLAKLRFGLSELKLDIKHTALPKGPSAIQLQTSESPYSSHYLALKTGSYAQNIIFRRRAMENGYDDVLFVRENRLLEASTSAVIFHRGKTFVTPADKSILKSVTCQLLEKFCRDTDHKFIQRPMSLDELSDYEHVFLANSVQFLTSVTRIDDNNYSENNNLNINLQDFLRDKL